MRLTLNLKTIPLGIAIVTISFLAILLGLAVLTALAGIGGLAVATRHSRSTGACRIAAAAARVAQLQHHCAGCDCAQRHSRSRRSWRAAPLRRQGRQPDIADSAERGYRLDRLARADHRDRRPGCAVAGNPADGYAERDGLADVKGNRRDRGRARRIARQQRRQANRRREHQGPECQRGDQGQRRDHRAPEARCVLAHRAEFGRPGRFGRHQPFAGRRPGQCPGAGQAADRQDRCRSDRRGAGADPQRSLA